MSFDSARMCAQMRHYHFVIREGDRIEHEDGAVLPDDEVARAHAVRIICVLQGDEASRGSYTMEVGMACWYGASRSRFPTRRIDSSAP